MNKSKNKKEKKLMTFGNFFRFNGEGICH